MTDAEQRKAAKDFVQRWTNSGYERGEAQRFWLDMLNTVFGVPTEDLKDFIKFEIPLKTEKITSSGKIKKTTTFIDALILETKVLIEQKSSDKDLDAPIKQSDGSFLRPEQQAKKYIVDLPQQAHPAFVITCNFREFRIYDMNNPGAKPEVILLKDLPKEYRRLEFIVNVKSRDFIKEIQVSEKAGQIVGDLYDALLKEYKDPKNPESLKSLNKLCVRLVFLLYAESAGVLGEKNMFRKYLQTFRDKNIRAALIMLFKVLSTPPNERDPYLDDELAVFPYVNGGLFNGEKIEIPKFTPAILDLLIHQASEQFDWSEISPTIFGAVFESTLNPVTRRAGGMHYTSVENIHKVIDPLFLDELKAEFEEIKAKKPKSKRKTELVPWKKSLLDFQEKLASVCCFDPACGSGNFLTESYLSLRKLENEALKELHGDNIAFDFEGEHSVIKVGINQFYGIEINDFAVAVAKTALWIAESQMLVKTEEIIRAEIDFLPLKSYTNIIEGNALRIDWNEVAPRERVSYIMGNPPFVGYSLQSKEQKADILATYLDEKGKPYKKAGKIDYVAGWYYKAAEYLKDTKIRAAFVSTNSITQGEQVADVWKPLFDLFNIEIFFAHRTFKWNSESTDKAAVHCVIVGFAAEKTEKKVLFSVGKGKEVKNISPYLVESETVFVESRKNPLCDIPQMVTGNRPADGGHLIIEGKDYEDFIKREPKAVKYIKPLIGAEEFINNKKRYCLWLVGVSPNEIRKMPAVLERIEKCRQARLGGADDRKKLADTPTVFRETLNPNTAIVVPRHSSENRRYIPMGYISSDVICADSNLMIPNATLYHFGVLTSNVHMAWMRTVAGRLKSDYRYSNKIVYNNFPWPTPTDKQKAAIRGTAEVILNIRAKYKDTSLADLYDETTMPKELRIIHQANDRAVMAAYGFSVKMTEAECVGELFKLYRELAGE